MIMLFMIFEVILKVMQIMLTVNDIKNFFLNLCQVPYLLASVEERRNIKVHCICFVHFFDELSNRHRFANFVFT